MAEVVEMIQLSPTMEEGVLIEWLVNEGDEVSTGDLIAEIETDKASMEMESFFDGVLLKKLLEEGQSAKVGVALAIIGEKGEDISGLLAELESGSSGAQTADAQTADSKGGDSKPDDSSKDTSAKNDDEQDEKKSGAQDREATPAQREGDRLLASPVAKRIAEEEGIDLRELSGSGPAGRIVKRDVEEALERGEASKAASPTKTAATATATSESVSAEAERVPLSQMRKAIARNLIEAWKAPAFMLTRTVVMDRALALRKDVNEALEAGERGVKVSVNDLIIRASALALLDVPEMNVGYDGDALLQFPHADIGVAVAIEGGLITPIVRAAEDKTLSTIAASVRDLAERARNKKLKPEEYTGASFSISNLGMFDIDHFTAVLNPPGAGILAVGKTREVATFNENGDVVPQLEMAVTLTCDHRAVDGATGARFLQRFAHYLEQPLSMLA